MPMKASPYAGINLDLVCLESCLRDLDRSGKSCPFLQGEAETLALSVYNKLVAMRTGDRPALCDEAADTLR
jgi:hypothetical protein